MTTLDFKLGCPFSFMEYSEIAVKHLRMTLVGGKKLNTKHKRKIYISMG